MNTRLFAFVLLAGLLLVGCTQPAPAASPQASAASSATAQPSQPAIVSASASASAAATAGTPAVQEIAMTANSFEFTPSTVTVKKGVPVKFTITALDVPHGFFLSEFGISKELNPGTATVIEFTPDKTGSFPFICNVFCGEGHGSMKGTLVVQD